MQRLCGRPGCSDGASVAYGMRPEDLVFWLDVLPEDIAASAGVLCRRHADSMVVPRGWTLDDLRDPELHLFRPPRPAPAVRRRAPRTELTRSAPEPEAEQLRFGSSTDVAATTSVGGLDAGGVESVDDAAIDGTPTGPGPWSPSFDEADDLDGLLVARSPLLSRAFRTADRPSEP